MPTDLPGNSDIVRFILPMRAFEGAGNESFWAALPPTTVQSRTVLKIDDYQLICGIRLSY